MHEKHMNCRMGHRHAFGGFGRGRHGMGGHGHGHGMGLGRGGRERLFEHGDLKLVVMSLLKEKPRHGYEIIKALEEMVGGDYSPSPGVVYPTLTLLEELGHASVVETEGGRKLYTLTDTGQAFLADSQPAVDAVISRIERTRAGRSAPPAIVVRALESLHMALRFRMHEGSLTDEDAKKVAEAIDAAVAVVERR